MSLSLEDLSSNELHRTLHAIAGILNLNREQMQHLSVRDSGDVFCMHIRLGYMPDRWSFIRENPCWRLAARNSLHPREGRVGPASGDEGPKEPQYDLRFHFNDRTGDLEVVSDQRISDEIAAFGRRDD
jgi:hypothetical protein